ncbi:venom prothrombin activator vestarin-D2 [Nematostella vectensis]|uniref:venom prothrombin activator vestarin-D2 n=1 Tax=Nematostella vectensis TaxID=45351 RepID=UPI0020773CB7|nr:venom prothrombin activator vestarin-D2 [Nematostella vectensis]
MDAALSCYIIVQLSYILSANAEVFLVSNGLNRRNAKSLGKFRKHSNKYLNVSEKLTLIVERPGACVLACLRNESCFSLNLANTPDGRSKLLCEVLSTDIYNSSTKVQNNTSWTHYSIDTQCFFRPCQNNGSCQASYNDDNFTCACRPGYTGRHCEEPPGLSCKNILDQGRSRGSGKYFIDPENTGSVFPVYCDMVDEEGGWMMTLNLTFEATRTTFTPEGSFRSMAKFEEGYMGKTIHLE